MQGVGTISFLGRIILLAALIAFSAPQIAAADPVADRKAGFKANVTAFKAIKAAIASGNAKAAAAPSRAIAAFADKIPGLFPKGSGGGETRALLKIWDNWDDFVKAAATNKAAALAMASAAESGSVEALGAALKVTGGSCGSCHKPFRKPKT